MKKVNTIFSGYNLGLNLIIVVGTTNIQLNLLRRSEILFELMTMHNIG